MQVTGSGLLALDILVFILHRGDELLAINFPRPIGVDLLHLHIDKLYEMIVCTILFPPYMALVARSLSDLLLRLNTCQVEAVTMSCNSCSVTSIPISWHTTRNCNL